MDVVTVTVDGHTFAVVAGEDDNGLAVFELHADGTLTLHHNVDRRRHALNLWGASGLATATVDGVTYVLASGVYDDGLSVFAVGADGQLTNVSNISRHRRARAQRRAGPDHLHAGRRDPRRRLRARRRRAHASSTWAPAAR